MIKFLLKLAITALLVNASWRVGSAYLNYYQFKDAVQEMTQFRGDRPEPEIHQRIAQLADEHDLPMAEESFTVRRKDYHVIVDGGYILPIELAPGYIYQWPFAFHVDVMTLRAK